MKRLYKVWNGMLESAELLDEHYLCDGATIETYKIRKDDGTIAIVSKSFYTTTPLKAWEEALAEYVGGFANAIKGVDESLKIVNKAFFMLLIAHGGIRQSIECQCQCEECLETEKKGTS